MYLCECVFVCVTVIVSVHIVYVYARVCVCICMHVHVFACVCYIFPSPTTSSSCIPAAHLFCTAFSPRLIIPQSRSETNKIPRSSRDLSTDITHCSSLSNETDTQIPFFEVKYFLIFWREFEYRKSYYLVVCLCSRWTNI